MVLRCTPRTWNLPGIVDYARLRPSTCYHGSGRGRARSNHRPPARDVSGRGTLVLMTSLPEWLYPGPDGGWTADDLDALPPDAPRRIELIDGALVLMSPQSPMSWS